MNSDELTLLDIVRMQNPLRDPAAFPPEVVAACVSVDPRTLLALARTSKALRVRITRDVVLRSLLGSNKSTGTSDDDSGAVTLGGEEAAAQFLPRVSEALRAESIGAICPMSPLRLLSLAIATRCENCIVSEHPNAVRCFVHFQVQVDPSTVADRLLVQMDGDAFNIGPLRRSAARGIAGRKERDAAWFAAIDQTPAVPDAVASSIVPHDVVATHAPNDLVPEFATDVAARSSRWLPERAVVPEGDVAQHKLIKKLVRTWTDVALQRYVLALDSPDNMATASRTVETRLILPREGGEVTLKFRVLQVVENGEPLLLGPAWREVSLKIDPTVHRVASPSSFHFTVMCRTNCPVDAEPGSDVSGKQVEALVEAGSITDDALFLCSPCGKLLKSKLYLEHRHYMQAVERHVGLTNFMDEGNDVLSETLYETRSGELAGSIFTKEIVRRLKKTPQTSRRGEARLQKYILSVVGGQAERAVRLDKFAALRAVHPILFGTDEVAAFVDGMMMIDATARFRAVQGLRRHLSRTQRPPISQAIAYGAVTPLIAFLSDEYDTSMQFEAAWSLTNIASGSHLQTLSVVNHGGHRELVRLLSSPASNVAEQCVWACGNIAGDSAPLRDLMLVAQTMPPLLRLLEGTFATGNLSMQRNCVWALSNLLRGRPSPQPVAALDAVDLLTRVIDASVDGQAITDALWACAYSSDILSTHASDHGHADVSCGALHKIAGSVMRFITRRGGPLKLEHTELVPGLRSLGNMVAGIESVTQVAIDHGAICLFIACTKHERISISKEAFWSLSNTTAGSVSQIQAAIDAGVLALIVSAIQNHRTFALATMKEVFYCCVNLITDGSDEQVRACVAAFSGARAMMTRLNEADFALSEIVDSALREFYVRNVATVAELLEWFPARTDAIHERRRAWLIAKVAKVTQRKANELQVRIEAIDPTLTADLDETAWFDAIVRQINETPPFETALDACVDAADGNGNDGGNDLDNGEDGGEETSG